MICNLYTKFDEDLNNRFNNLESHLKSNDKSVNISSSDTQDLEMQDTLKKHFEKYPIKRKTDGRYYSYIPDESHPKGRRDITNKTKTGLINAIQTYYNNQNTGNIPFSNLFYKWVKYKEDLNYNKDTIRKLKTNYLRFFCKATTSKHKRLTDASFIKKPIRDIKKTEIELLVSENIRLYDLKEKACNSLFEILNGVFTYAYQEEITDNNVMDRVNAKALRRFCRQETKEEFEQRFVSDDEYRIFLNHITEYHSTHPNNMRTLAMLFEVYAGCRVGELGGLLWSDIYFNDSNNFADGGSINISHSLKKDGNEWVLSNTKTRKERTIAITQQIAKILQSAKDIQDRLKYTSEYVFAFLDNKNKIQQMKSSNLQNFMRDRCKEIGIRRLNPTMLRKASNIAMLSVGTDDSIRTSTLGHTTQVNRNNYTYNGNISIEAKKQAQQNANNYIDEKLNLTGGKNAV